MKVVGKRFWAILAVLFAGIIIIGNGFYQDYKTDQLLDLESRKCFDFFWEQVNTDKESGGYGLIRDAYPRSEGVSSIASVGFGLSAIVIGVEREWITYDEGKERVEGTLDTFLNTIEDVNGFYHHFLDMETGEALKWSEVSNIDTAILLCGAITAGEYYGGTIQEKAKLLYDKVDWAWFYDENKEMFRMAYKNGRGFSGYWDFYAEQLMMYILAAGSETHPIDGEAFYSFYRNEGQYNDKKHINSWFGSIFTYQFSHAWIDFRGKVDREGVNWWQNSVIASELNRDFCMEKANEFESFGADSWGLTACDNPYDGSYNGKYGTPASGYGNAQHFYDGTVPPAGAAGSIVFTPEAAISAMHNYYNNYGDLWGEYGFKDSFAQRKGEELYIDEDVIGIDKGITLLMIENYRSGLIWEYFMKNQSVTNGMAVCEVFEE